ncbi:MAG: hypothetical protein COB98_09065, partial [Flavobacteriaceae bacterium]
MSQVKFMEIVNNLMSKMKFDVKKNATLLLIIVLFCPSISVKANPIDFYFISSYFSSKVQSYYAASELGDKTVAVNLWEQKTQQTSTTENFMLIADADGDGVQDIDDFCPDTPVGAVVNARGCPDSDGDGISDEIDLDDDNDGISDIDEGYEVCIETHTTNVTAGPSSHNLTPGGANFWGGCNWGNGHTSSSALSINTQNDKTGTYYWRTSLRTLPGVPVTIRVTGTITNLGHPGMMSSSITVSGGGSMSLSKNGATSRTATYTINNPGSSVSINASFNIVNNACQWAPEANFYISVTPQSTPNTRYSCSSRDTDGDGIPNYLDLDSDGDGCPDALEAGIDSALVTDGIVQGPYGANGMAASIESDDTATATINYFSHYSSIGLNDTLNGCDATDSDNDQVADVFDIDDDNDGLLDVYEKSLGCAVYTEHNVGAFTYVGDDNVVMNATNNEITLKDTGWDNTYATQLLDLPIHLEFKNPTTSGTGMIGLTPEFISTTAGKGHVDGATYRFYSATSTMYYYDIGHTRRTVGTLDTTATYSIDIDVDGNLTYSKNNVVIVTATGAYLGKYRLRFSSRATETYSDIVLTSGSVVGLDACENFDIDNDGIFNWLDLDSDGDGCSDAQESSVPSASLEDATSPDLDNAIATGPYGNNGLADSLEGGDDSFGAITTYGSTHYIALSSTLNACSDTDNDGIGDLLDIDDDNDGILDTTEMQCGQAMAVTDSTTGSAVNRFGGSFIKGTNSALYAISFSNLTTNLLAANVYDGEGVHYIIDDALAGAYGAEISVKPQGTTLLDFVEWGPNLVANSDTENDNDDQEILLNWTPAVTAIVVDPNNELDIADGTFINSGQTIVQLADYTDTNLPTWKIVFYTNFLAVEFKLATLHSSAAGDLRNEGFSLKVNLCNREDTDNDGVVNLFDLDSDADGCSDSVESSNTLVGDNNIIDYNSGADVNQNGLIDSFEDGTSGKISYTSSYNFLAISNSLNACADTDGDGVGDLLDIDDDNDGVLDAVESPDCFYSEIEAEVITNVISTMAVESTARPYTNAFDGDDSNSSYTGFSPSKNGIGISVYEITPTVPMALESLNFSMYNLAFTNGAANKVKMQGFINGSWEDLSLAENKTVINAIETFTNTLHPTTIYTKFRITGASGVIYYARVKEIYLNANAYIASLNNKPTCTTDTDGDGILNHLDLDADGDECSDAVEAGNALVSANNITAFSSGADSNQNGLLDQYEDGTSGAINYVSSYNPIAISDSLNACADTDGDGVGDLLDIDDDNDGVLDAVESPDCFYSEIEAEVITNVISTMGVESAARPYTNAFDGDDSTTSYTGFTPNKNGIGISVYEITPTVPMALESVKFSMHNLAFTNGAANKVKLQGFINGSWEDLSLAENKTVVSNIETFTNTLHPTTIYNKFRITGASGVIYYARVKEIYLNANAYIASLNNKPTCTTDTDGDGILNHLDLDSDGDGCSDAVESGNTLVSGNNITTFVSGADVNQNGLLDQFEDGTSGAINYVSSYNPIAISNSLNACADTDGDGVGDLLDIDDDNDGVLDAVESPDCFYTLDDVKILNVTTTLTNYSTSTSYQFAELYDGIQNDIASYGALSTPIAGETVYELELAFPVELNTIDIVFQYSVFKTAATFKWQGFDGAQWVDVTEVLNEVETTNNTYSYSLNQTGVRYQKYRLLGVSGDSYYNRIYEIIVKANAATFQPSLYPKASCSQDTDGDGILNHLDLDSDGDKCSDAVEAGNTLVSANNITTFVSGADVNQNGLLDQFEDGTSGSVNYTSTYQENALNNQRDACADTDGDGIGDLTDIDDDNDGILDVDEQTKCKLSVLDLTDLSFEGNVTNEIISSNKIVLPGGTGGWVSDYSVETFKLPINLKFTVPETGATENGMLGLIPIGANHLITSYNDGSYKFFVNNHITYGYFPTAWSSTTNPSTGLEHELNITAAGVLTAKIGGIQVFTKNIAVSEYQLVITGHSSPRTFENIALTVGDAVLICEDKDTDNDGVPNRLDLDSDNDGCSDAVESGNTLVSSNNIVDFSTGADVNKNGLLDTYEDGTSGTINYISTYVYNALNKERDACADTDGDGIGDLIDIDDDNDGILDVDECPGSLKYTLSNVNDFNFTAGNLSGTQNTTKDISHRWDLPIGSVIVSILNASTTSTGSAVTGGSLANVAYTFSGDMPVYVRVKQGGSIGAGVSEGIIATDNVSYSFVSTLTDVNLEIVKSGNNYSIKNNASTFINNGKGFIWASNDVVSKLSIYTTSTNVNSNYSIILMPSIPNPCPDTDNDSIPDSLDLDSDNDGIYDAVEAGHGMPVSPKGDPNAGRLVDTNVGANGFVDSIEEGTETGTYVSTYNNGDGPVNSDSTEGIDAIDTDSDDDGCLDVDEAYNNFMPTSLDTDGNGSFGATGTVTSGYVDADGTVVQASYASPADGNNDGIADYTQLGLPMSDFAKINSLTPLSEEKFVGESHSITADLTSVNLFNVVLNWIVSTDDGVTWTALSNDTHYAGVHTVTLLLNDIISSMDNTHYKLVIYANNNVCSSIRSNDTSVLTVNSCEIDLTAANFTPVIPSTCSPATDGAINITNAGFNPGDSYIVNYKDATATAQTATLTANATGELLIPNLVVGTYSEITITSSLNATCTETYNSTVSIIEFVSNISAVVTKTDETSVESNDGTIQIVPSDGTPAYVSSIKLEGATTELWTAETTTNLAPGTYNILVIDAKGCRYTNQVVIEKVPACTIDVTITSSKPAILCFGDSDITLTANTVIPTGSS